MFHNHCVSMLRLVFVYRRSEITQSSSVQEQTLCCMFMHRKTIGGHRMKKQIVVKRIEILGCDNVHV